MNRRLGCRWAPESPNCERRAAHEIWLSNRIFVQSRSRAPNLEASSRRTIVGWCQAKPFVGASSVAKRLTRKSSCNSCRAGFATTHQGLRDLDGTLLEISALGRQTLKCLVGSIGLHRGCFASKFGFWSRCEILDVIAKIVWARKSLSRDVDLASGQAHCRYYKATHRCCHPLSRHDCHPCPLAPYHRNIRHILSDRNLPRCSKTDSNVKDLDFAARSASLGQRVLPRNLEFGTSAPDSLHIHHWDIIMSLVGQPTS